MTWYVRSDYTTPQTIVRNFDLEGTVIATGKARSLSVVHPNAVLSQRIAGRGLLSLPGGERRSSSLLAEFMKRAGRAGLPT
jgi:hypothetical protein